MSMDEEKLIVIVSQYLEIYDVQHENYMNTSRKKQLWSEIAQEMGVSENLCKEKWKSLRDGYHRCLKNRKSKSGDGASKIKKWKYENQMEFLQQYLYERETKGNFGDAGSITSDENVNSPHHITPISPEPENSHSSSATSTMFKKMSARKKKTTSEPSVASVLQKYIDSRPSTRTPTTENTTENPIFSFFKAMADSVVTLPPDLQLKAKNQIFLTVSNLEYENLQRKTTAGQTQNIQVQQVELDDSTITCLGEQFEGPGFNEPQNTPTVRTQTIHDSTITTCLGEQFEEPGFNEAQNTPTVRTQTIHDSTITTCLGEQFEEPGFNEAQNTPTVRTQTIHIPKDHTDSHTESQSILAPAKYILTTDGRLLNVNYVAK